MAEAGGYLVAVTTELDAALEREGYARELVRRIQQLRKDAGLEISDRIVTYVVDSELVHEVLQDFGDYVRDETLTVDLVQVHSEQGDAAARASAAGGVRAGGQGNRHRRGQEVACATRPALAKMRRTDTTSAKRSQGRANRRP